VVKVFPVHTVKTQGRREGEIKLHSFLNSESNGDERSDIRPGQHAPKEITSCYFHLDGV
jgi:hypothetical protein